MNIKKTLIVVSSLGLMFLTACSDNTSNSNNTPSFNPAEVAQSPLKNDPPQESKGGQVIESGAYHLEFVPELESTGTHIDFYLQKSDNHEAISDAKVTAQIQLPNGTQQSFPLAYDSEGKHYAALIPGRAPGDYNIAILSDIKGEKVNGRFMFKR